MTGTRAPAASANGCWRWSCTPRPSTEGGPATPATLPPPLHRRSALDGPRSFVLAALRALHRCPRRRADGRPPVTEGMAHNTETICFVGIDRPRSFRDDTQRHPSEHLILRRPRCLAGGVVSAKALLPAS